MLKEFVQCLTRKQKKDSFSLFVLTVGKRKECFKKEKGKNFVDSNCHLKNTLEKMGLAF